MSNDIVIPFAGRKMAGAFAALVQGPEPESLADGIGSSYSVIGYKGKTWSLRHRGDRHTFTRPDDGSPASYIDVIILRQARAKSKSYYEAYVEGEEGKRPICASLDGVVPDRDVTTKQAEACAVCPRNEWKTSPDGRKTRECSDYKRLAVLILPSQTKALLGSPLLEPAFLRVPPASLNNLSSFGDTMAGQGYHYSSFVTRIIFDVDAATPKFIFRPLQELTDKEAPTILKMREDIQAKRITGEDAEGGNRPLLTAAATGAPQKAATAAPAASAATATQTPTPVTTVQPTKPVEPVSMTKSPSEPAHVDVGLSLGAVADPLPGTQSISGGPGILDLTAETAPSTLVPTGEAATQTAADVGEASESDDALDAQINALLKV